MKTIRASLLFAALAQSAASAEGSATFGIAESQPASAKPNIVFILADDLGYGDVHCLNPKHGRIPTPNLDKLAAQGMVFTDAHSSASVCTPTRYGLLTGRYNWRSRLQAGVMGSYQEPLIAADRLTVAEMLKGQGYATGCVGKWHLGMHAPGETEETMKEKIAASKYRGNNWLKTASVTDIDWTKPIADGPLTRGFGYYFGMDFPNGPPFCFIENDRTVGVPSASLDVTGVRAKYEMGLPPGLPALPGWDIEAVLPTLTDKAGDFIRRNAKAGKPFFLYFPMTSPHTPTAPSKEWQGKSGLGKYGDFVMETDAMVGKTLAALEESGVAGNTLVIFSADNGPSLTVPSVHAANSKGHRSSAQFRGGKSDAWDGGHREPLIVRWPGTVKAGTQCGQMVCLNDFMATCAEITGAKMPDDAGEDSVSLLPLLRGTDKPVRDTLVHHSIQGKFAIRDGKWKLILCPGSGGWSAGPASPPVQLYDMSVDEIERKNLQAEHPEIVERLATKLEKMVADGRSTPGSKKKNDVPVDIFKRKTVEESAHE